MKMELIECIERIPSRLNYVIQDIEGLYQRLNQYINGNYIDEIVVIASGSSYNAALASKNFCLNQCKLQFRAIYPNEFLHGNGYINENALYVVISQGGKTKLVYEVLEILKNKKMKNCTITEDLNSPIALIGDVKVDMGSDKEEFLYRTIGFSTTVTRCFQIESIVSVLGNKNEYALIDEVTDDLTKAISNLDEIRQKTLNWYSENKQLFYDKSKIILAGASYLFPISNEADIKLMEMVPIMTRSFELEELIHGPQNAFDDSTIYFLLSDKRFEWTKVTSISDFIQKEIGQCIIVGDAHHCENDIVFEYKSEYFRGLENITVFQVLSYLLAKERKRDLSKGVNSSIQNYIKKQL